MKDKKRVFLIMVSILFLTLVFSFASELSFFGYKGISEVAGNTEDFYVTHETIEGTYSVQLDLDDLDSNIGKVVYEDGEYKIYIDTVDIDDVYYRIHFRCEGEFSSNGASLVSGVKHNYSEQSQFTSMLESKLQLNIDGKISDCEEYAVELLNYKKGDGFSYYLMKNADYNGEQIQITISNLIKNKWLPK